MGTACPGFTTLGVVQLLLVRRSELDTVTFGYYQLRSTTKSLGVVLYVVVRQSCREVSSILAPSGATQLGRGVGRRAPCVGAQHVTHQLYQVLPVTIGYYQRMGVVLLALVLTPYPSFVSSATSYDQACAALEERSTGPMSSPDSDQLMLAGLWFAQEPY